MDEVAGADRRLLVYLLVVSEVSDVAPEVSSVGGWTDRRLTVYLILGWIALFIVVLACVIGIIALSMYAGVSSNHGVD